MTRILLLLFAAATVVTAAAVSGIARPDAARGADPGQRTVVTTAGRGTVVTVPDTTTISFGVRSDAATADAAMDDNAARMQRVVAALRGAGADEIQTSEIALYPRNRDGGDAIVGYTASNTVTVKAKVARAGALVDAAVGAGANNVQGMALDRSDRDALYRDALAKALKDARAKADALAGAGGFSVGRVVRVSERGSEEPIYDSGTFMAATRQAATPVEPGKQSIEAVVRVSFAIE